MNSTCFSHQIKEGGRGALLTTTTAIDLLSFLPGLIEGLVCFLSTGNVLIFTHRRVHSDKSIYT